MLKSVVDRTQQRLDSIDDHGTRGIGVLQTQILDLTKDVTSLQAEMNIRFDGHLKLHEEEERKRISSRRWIIGTVIGGMASMGTVIAMLVDVLQHVH